MNSLVEHLLEGCTSSVQEISPVDYMTKRFDSDPINYPLLSVIAIGK